MAVIIGSARISEHGTTSGSAGDQTGSEVSTQEFYMHSKGWVILRAKSDSVAAGLAEAMKELCANDNVGYSQSDRDSLLTQYKRVGQIKLISVKCNCDCSSGVRVCIYQASGTLVSDFTTASEADVLVASGLFEKKTCNSVSDVQNGDILVTKTKGHTAIVISGAPRSGSSTSSGSTSSTGTTSSSGTAESYDASIAGTYSVTASSLNIRSGAGTSYKVLTTVAKGGTVQNYGYYSTVNKVKWYYVVANGVTGFADSEYLSKKSSGSTSGSTSSGTSSLPTYKVGSTYTIQVDKLAVRTGAGTSYAKKSKSQLTINGKANAYSDGSLKKGTRVTCQATRTVNGEVWMQIPSGWVAAYYGGKKYIS